MTAQTTYAATIGATRTESMIVIRRAPFLPNCPNATRDYAVMVLNPSHWFHSIEHMGRKDTEGEAVAEALDLAAFFKIPFIGTITD